jgi:hypothetical protein
VAKPSGMGGKVERDRWLSKGGKVERSGWLSRVEKGEWPSQEE